MTDNDAYDGEEYLTKSRLKTWLSCRRKYFYQYVAEIETEDTDSMVRGLEIHKIIEEYYKNATEYSKNNSEPPTTMFSLINDGAVENWEQYLDPYLAHFFGFERRRWQNVDDISDWIPVAIEQGMWEEDAFEDTEIPPITGYADVLLPARSIDEDAVPNEGVVLLDFKTGEPKDEKYQSKEQGGIYLDLSYYKILFESDYDIRAVGGYYPKTDTLVVSTIGEERRRFIESVSAEISEADPNKIEDYPLDTGPLCAWDEDEDSRCEYYDECPSRWAEPVDNKDLVVDMIQDGYSNEEIADEIDTTVEAMEYWVHKKRWFRYRK